MISNKLKSVSVLQQLSDFKSYFHLEEEISDTGQINF